MGTYYFYNPDDGRTFGIRGPDTLTREQAQKIFDQQKSVGALISLRAGQQITPEFQLANGLRTAEAAVLTDVRQSIAAGNVVIDPVFSKIPVTAGITAADYAKQSEAGQSIGNIGRAEVTGLLAQVKRLTGQRYADATNLGAGQYAFTVSQLEKAGYIKPGTSGKYLSTNTYSTLSVLNMNNSWTGKEGVTQLNQLLQSADLQDRIQQFLMVGALNQLIEVGIGIESMPASQQAGLLLLGAIDPALAVSWVKNPDSVQPIKVYGPLPYTEINNWQVPQTIVRDAAYAVEFSLNRTNAAMKNQTQGRGYTHTVERQAINSAANQIVGNAKVPKITYGAESVNPDLLKEFDALSSKFVSINTSVQSVLSQAVTATNGITKESQLIALRRDLVLLKAEIDALVVRAEQSAPVSTEFLAALRARIGEILATVATIDSNLQFISRLLGRRSAV